jgi:hypothetical protein
MDERKAAANSAQAQPEKGMRLCAARYAQYGTLSPIKFILNYGFLLKMVIRSGIRFERFDFFLV